MIGKPKVILTSTNLNDPHEEVKDLLDEFVDIVVDDLSNESPPLRSRLTFQIKQHTKLPHRRMRR